MINVKVHTILNFKKLLGQREFSIALEEGSTVRDLLSSMIRQWGDALSPHLFDPSTDQVLPHIRLLVNGQDIQFLNGAETVLHDEDEFSLLPMLTGG